MVYDQGLFPKQCSYFCLVLFICKMLNLIDFNSGLVLCVQVCQIHCMPSYGMHVPGLLLTCLRREIWFSTSHKVIQGRYNFYWCVRLMHTCVWVWFRCEFSRGREGRQSGYLVDICVIEFEIGGREIDSVSSYQKDNLLGSWFLYLYCLTWVILI